MCKKGFKSSKFNFIKGEFYFHWTNFQELNHFISDKEYSKDNDNIIPFDGDKNGSRAYLYDYFWTKEECRNIKINKIID